MTYDANLQSGVLTSPADEMLARAISETLRAPASDRARLFEEFVREIESYMAVHPQERPWTCTIYTGTEGSRIFRGGLGHSLVIDADGRLWRARSYEDFNTTYTFNDGKCEIGTLTPLFDQMREYQPSDFIRTAVLPEDRLSSLDAQEYNSPAVQLTSIAAKDK